MRTHAAQREDILFIICASGARARDVVDDVDCGDWENKMQPKCVGHVVLVLGAGCVGI